MWELFGVTFDTLGFIFELQEGFGLPSGALKGVFVLFSDFGCNLGVNVGPLVASILGCFSVSFRERSRSDPRASPDGFWSNFGSMLAPFWESFGVPWEK